MWSELSERCSSLPGCLHLHFNAACAPIQLQIQAKLRLGPLQAEIGEGQASIPFATWGKYELPLSSLKNQGMPGLARGPYPYCEEVRQAKVDGSPPNRKAADEYTTEIQCRPHHLSAARQTRASATP